MIRHPIVNTLAMAAAAFALAGCAALGELEERMSAAGGLGPTPKDDAEIAAIDAAQEAKAQREAAKLAPPPEQDRPEDPPAAPETVEASPVELPAPAVESAPAPSEPPAPPAAASPPPPAPPYVAPAPARFTPVGKPAIVARVDSVQFPAWVERGGVRAPIKAGWAIYTSDRIMTGGEGRVGLSFFGEGRMKIGGRADVLFAPNQSSDSDVAPPLGTVRRGSVLVSTLGGVGGTTLMVGDAIEANLASGQMLLQATESEDLLALVDGSVLVSGPKLNPGTINQPSSFIRVPRRGRAGRLSEASASRLAQWLSPTQSTAGRPELKAEGVWDVSLNSGYNLKKLETMVCRIQGRGVPAEIYPVREPGKQTWYRVVVRRFESRNAAVGFLSTAKSMGATQPWVLLPST